MNRRLFFRSAVFLLSIAWVTLAPAAEKGSKATSAAYFAGGCFWCTEEIFSQAPGVISVESGYMRDAETIQIRFDPARTNYESLLKLFWRAHDPTEVDRQGPDSGKKYRSAIFYLDEEQRTLAEMSKAQLAASKTYPRPIATEISRATNFTAAETRHQDFYRKNPNNPYVAQWLEPKLKKLGMTCR